MLPYKQLLEKKKKNVDYWLHMSAKARVSYSCRMSRGSWWVTKWAGGKKLTGYNVFKCRDIYTGCFLQNPSINTCGTASEPESIKNYLFAKYKDRKSVV